MKLRAFQIKLLLLTCLFLTSSPNKTVGAGLVPARVMTNHFVLLKHKNGQGQALPLQFYSVSLSGRDR